MAAYEVCRHCRQRIKLVGLIRREWVTVEGGNNGCAYNPGAGHTPR